MFFCIAIMVLGVVGNIMVPIVIVKTKDMRNSTNIFLTNLSVADLLVLLICTPTVLVEVNTPPETWVLGYAMCKAVPFVESTVAHASVLTILAISFERYYAICEPLKAGYVCTKTRAIVICLSAWGIAALFTSPIIVIARYSTERNDDGTDSTICATAADSFWPSAYFIGTISFFFFIPFGILVVLYAAIAYKLLRPNSAFHRPTSPLATNNPTTSGTAKTMPRETEINKGTSHQQSNCMRKHRKQVIFMLVAVVSSFFICLLPIRVFLLWVISASNEDIANMGIECYYSLLYFTRFMLYLNSALNPILYNLMSSKFRSGFLRLIMSCSGRWQYRHQQHHHHRGQYKSHQERSVGSYQRSKRIGDNTANVAVNKKEVHHTLHREATFLINSMSTSSGNERTSWRSNSLSTSIGLHFSITEAQERTILGEAIVGMTAATVSTAHPSGKI